MTKEEILDKHLNVDVNSGKYPNSYPYITEAMQDYSDQENKELKEIVLQLQKDFVVKLEENAIYFSVYIRENWLPEEGKKYTWWNPINNKFAYSEELYFYYLQSLNK